MCANMIAFYEPHIKYGNFGTWISRWSKWNGVVTIFSHFFHICEPIPGMTSLLNLFGVAMLVTESLCANSTPLPNQSPNCKPPFRAMYNVKQTESPGGWTDRLGQLLAEQEIFEIYSQKKRFGVQKVVMSKKSVIMSWGHITEGQIKSLAKGKALSRSKKNSIKFFHQLGPTGPSWS